MKRSPGRSATPVSLALMTALALGGCAGEGAESRQSEQAAQSEVSVSEQSSPSAESGQSLVGQAAEHVDNPYVGASGYVNAEWASKVRSTAQNVEAEEAALALQMEMVAQQSTAVWMDRTAAIDGYGDRAGLAEHLDAALEQQTGDEPVVVTVVVYNLPGRDCAAGASNGELPATEEGLAQYETEFIDPITEILADPKYQDLRVVTVLEPDSLPNLVTNADQEGCQQAGEYYKQGIAYALDSFGELPGVYTYLDAGHAGWLGWDSNAQPTAELFAQVVSGTALGFDSVDGFATNVANYTPVEETYLTDPELAVGGQPVKSASFYEWNPDLSESDYTADLYSRLVAAGFPSEIGMIVDTSRNGWAGTEEPTSVSASGDLETYVDESRIDRRTHRGAWCNQAGAGLGYLPQAEPEGYQSSHIDAFVWVKPPGESDGSSAEVANDQGKGADPMCDPDYVAPGLGNRSTGALANAPLSGEWFEEQFVELVRNARQSS